MNILEEVKKDRETILEKEMTIKGYRVIKKLLKLLPRKFRDYVELEEDVLFFSWKRIGKLSNIDEITQYENYEAETTLDYLNSKHINITRVKGEDINIYFKWGRNEETGKPEYIDYIIVVGD